MDTNESERIFEEPAVPIMEPVDRIAPYHAARRMLCNMLPLSGGSMTGPLSVLAPVAYSHAASKGYVDSRHRAMFVFLPASGWVGESAPFTQTIAVEGILEEDCPLYGIVLSGTVEQKLEQLEAYGCINELRTEDGLVTFRCLEDKPDADMTVQMNGIRVGVTDGDSALSAMLLLDEDASGYITIASIDGHDYGIKNGSVSIGAANGSYDFTIH